jgi:nucleoside-diphosphate-sugar epimerase
MNIIGINGYNGFIAQNFLLNYKSKHKIIHFKKNINNIKEFKKFALAKNYTHFIHFAGLNRKKCASKRTQCQQINFLSIKKTIDFLNTLKIKPVFIFISSSHIYGYSKNKLKENSKTKPKDLYGRLKLKSENYIKKKYKNSCILRIFNVYGKDQPPSFFVPDMISKIKNKEEITINKSIRDFIHVDEVSKIINFTIKKKILGTINVGSGKGVTLKYIVKNIGKYIDIKPHLTENKFSDKIVANISLLKSYGYKQNKNAKYFNI